MSERILLVDDELNVLHGYQRALRKSFQLDVAASGAEALEAIEVAGPYAVIVSDMRMPEMNGVELLSIIKERAPDTVRMMLTGNSDQQTAIDAINQGDIFRFLNKPCDKDEFSRALERGIHQYHLITAEKELLQKTLAGSIRVLAEVLSIADPAAFGRTARLVKLTRSIYRKLGIEREWWHEPAVLLSQIGCITLPENVSRKIASGQSLNNEEYQLYKTHPDVGSGLLARIPRMQEVVDCIRYQEKNYDGTGMPHGAIKGRDIPLSARILKVALDFDRGDAAGLLATKNLSRLQRQSKWYDPDILEALNKIIIGEAPVRLCKMTVNNLKQGMVLAEDVKTNDGLLLLAKGLVMTSSALQRLANFHDNGQIPGVVMIALNEPTTLDIPTGAAVNQ